MILKVDDLKKMLGISTSTETDNAQINALIPIAQDMVFDYMNNLFLNPRVYIRSSAVQFSAPASGANSKITAAAETFIADGFFAEANFVVAGSLINDGIYRIQSLTDTVLTLTGDTILKTEAAGAADSSILIQRMDVPDPVKLAIAKIVGEDLKKNMSSAAEKESERIGDYSVTYSKTSGPLAGYSEDIKNLLNKYRKPQFAKQEVG
jgi:hypothetical protein